MLQINTLQKISSLSFLLIFISTTSLAQGSVQFSLAVINHRNQPLGGLTVVAMETTTLQSQTAKTNSQGRVQMSLGEGKEWIVSIGQIRNAMHVVSIRGRQTMVNKMYVYDYNEYNRKKQQDDSRTNERFKVVSRGGRKTQYQTR